MNDYMLLFMLGLSMLSTGRESHASDEFDESEIARKSDAKRETEEYSKLNPSEFMRERGNHEIRSNNF